MLVIGKCCSGVCSTVILYSVHSYFNIFIWVGMGIFVYDMDITL